MCSKKKCTKCNIEKPLEDFYTKGNDKYHSHCKSCEKIYFKQLYKTNERRTKSLKIAANNTRGYNTNFVQRYKLFCGCKICGYKKTYHALELHHLKNKSKEISQMKTVSITTLKKEMRKCIVVCANCHREIHAGLINGDIAQLVEH